MEHIIVLTGDNHLRDTQYGYPSRGLDFLSSLERIVDTAITDKKKGRPIAAIMNSGDLLDNTRPSPAIIRFLNRLHNKLIKANLAMYVISGNHDRTSPHWTDVLEPDLGGMGVVCADNQILDINLNDSHHLKFQCLPFCSKEDLLYKLEYEVPKTGIDGLMWHGAIQELVKFPMESAIKAEDFPKNRFQCILSGDIHVNQIVTLSDGITKIISPGSTEICKSDEPLQKYVMELGFTTDIGVPARLTSITPVPIKTRKVLCYRLVTEEDVEQALKEVKACMNEGPLVLIRSNPSLPNVMSRFNVAVDRSKCILKIGALPSTQMAAVTVSAKAEEMVTPADLLHIYVPPGTELFNLAQQMVNPDVNENDALEQYCEHYLGSLNL